MVALVFVWVAFYARSHKELFQVLLIPAVFCTLAFLGFLGFYQLRVGVIRPGLFFAYVNEFGALPIDPTISTITRFCGGDMVTSLISDLSQNSDRRSSPRSFWVMGSAFRAVWATAVYLISRSHEKNVLNLTPIWLTILALSLRFGKNSLALIQTASLIMLSSFAFYQKPLHFFEAVSSIISKIPFQAGNGAIWDSSRCSELIEREWCSLVFLSTSFASNSNGDFFHWIPMVLLISSILSLDQQFQDIHRSIGDSNGGFWSQITSVRRVFFRTLRSFSGSEFNQFNIFCWKHFS